VPVADRRARLRRRPQLQEQRRPGAPEGPLPRRHRRALRKRRRGPAGRGAVAS
jgi:hypothetical protein